jgi:hypothetical protein
MLGVVFANVVILICLGVPLCENFWMLKKIRLRLRPCSNAAASVCRFGSLCFDVVKSGLGCWNKMIFIVTLQNCKLLSIIDEISDLQNICRHNVLHSLALVARGECACPLLQEGGAFVAFGRMGYWRRDGPGVLGIVVCAAA